MAHDTNEKVVATNRKAFHDYSIEEKLEAGIVLKGTEVRVHAVATMKSAGGQVVLSETERALHVRDRV